MPTGTPVYHGKDVIGQSERYRPPTETDQARPSMKMFPDIIDCLQRGLRTLHVWNIEKQRTEHLSDCNDSG